jgi:hypothetical protein
MATEDELDIDIPRLDFKMDLSMNPYASEIINRLEQATRMCVLKFSHLTLIEPDLDDGSHRVTGTGSTSSQFSAQRSGKTNDSATLDEGQGQIVCI